MSDFGLMITVKRKDDSSLCAEDIVSIEESLNRLNSKRERTDASGESISLKAVKSIELNETASICAMITEFWGEGLDQGFYYADSVDNVLAQD